MTIKLGCCGWAVRGGRRAYYDALGLIEVQSTFYKLPRVKTVEKWRKEAPEGFEFTIKAWQAITHPPGSPTWRKAGFKVPREKEDRYGYLRPTSENFEAWGRIREICNVLGATVCVVQCPPSFKPTADNIENMVAFLSEMDRDRIEIAWEPRGTWREQGRTVRKLCDSLDLIHVVDIFRWKPLSRSKINYLRLHGIGKGEANYAYRYSDEDLHHLLKEARELETSSKEVYILFNNISMFQDLSRFKQLLSASLSNDEPKKR